MLISDVYEMMQESELLQEKRGNYEAKIEKIVKTLLANISLDKETIRDELYDLAAEAEKAGFAVGFRSGIILMIDCFL